MLLSSCLIGMWLVTVVDAGTWERNTREESDNSLPSLDRNKRLHRKLKAQPPWQKAVLPYTIDDAVLPNKPEYDKIMALYEGLTCVRLPHWNESTAEIYGLNHNHHMRFVEAGGCWVSGRRISCCSNFECVHEIGHMLGFAHEQNDPMRDGWIRANWNDMWPSNRGTYQKDDAASWDTENYVHDLTSPMHYKPWMYGVRTGSMSALFPELSIHWELFEFFKEVAYVYRCATSPPCEGMDLKCENDGYQTVLGGKCSCACPTGLDPEDACKTPLKKVTSASWPKGQYALPKPQTGCPNGGAFQEGQLTQTGAAGNSISDPNHLAGEVKDAQAELHFCTRTTADDVFDTEDAAKFNWPVGNFCFYGKGNNCPTGFTTSAIEYKVASVTTSGQAPGGSFAGNTVKMTICCQYRSFHEQPITLPADKPFYLIKLGSKCQAVTGMHSYSESFTIRSDDQIKTNQKKWLGNGGKSLTVPLCYYQAIDMDCGGSITLSRSKPVVTIDMSGQGRTDLECTWVIKGDSNESTLVLDFEEFNVKKEGKNCLDSVEVRHSRIGQLGQQYCGEQPVHSIRSVTDKLLVRFFTTGTSDSSFKATIRLTEYEDMCFDLKDQRGAGYDGPVNYTRLFQPCLPWAQMSECYHHPFNDKDLYASLDGNFCRNPDNSFRPWCYTDKTGCRREYCDVCGIEIPHDRVDYCDELRDKGFCTTNASLAVQYCPNTCFDLLPSSQTPTKKYTDVTCGQPTPPSDGIVDGKVKATYSLGEVVQYKCSRGLSVVTSRCMTSGHWSGVGSACLECPIGYAKIDDSCYGLMQEGKAASFGDAGTICKNIGGILAAPKTAKENSVIRDLAGGRTTWLAISDKDTEGAWVYDEDGTKIVYDNWESGEPNDWGTEDCAVMKSSSKWNDIPCHYSYAVVCEIPKTELQCIDLLGRTTCQKILTDRPTMCTDFPDFASINCPVVCGLCKGHRAKCSVQNPNPNVLTGTDQQDIYVGQSVHYDCVRFTYPTKGDKHQACLPGGKLSGEPLHCEECPVGFTMVNNACHGLVVTEALSFPEAKAVCEKTDGFLAMPKSQQENDAISTLGVGQRIWIGLADQGHEGTFVWGDGSKLGWTNWKSGDPKPDGGQLDCTVMEPDKTWVNVKCQEFRLPAVCTIPKSGPTVCYDRTDKGLTYNGQVHVTTDKKVCGNWVDKGHCNAKSPFNKGKERYNLESNYCRNPADGDRPWCYTDGCSWSYCDVCDPDMQPSYDLEDNGKMYRGTAHVTVNGDVCEDWADKGSCPVNPSKSKYAGLSLEKNYCRNPDGETGPWCYTKGCSWALCGMSLADPLIPANIVDVTCTPPLAPSDGQMVSLARSSYKLGDEVTFKCTRNGFLVTATCLTNGDWTPVGFACSECPIGYDPFNGTCYGFVDKMLNYVDAVLECSKMGGHLPRPKSLEENTFVKNMNHGKYIWLDARIRNGADYTWSDGTDVAWLMGKRSGYECGFMNLEGEWGATACEFIQPKQMFICAVPQLENPECDDFLEDQCARLLTDKPSMCQDHVEFAERFCSKTCGTCGDVANNCTVEPTDNFSEVSTDALTIGVGQYVQYSCKAGLSQAGGYAQRACLPSGQLTGSAIKCQVCPAGYVEHNKFCYGFVDKSVTFKEAVTECKNINGYVASPKTQAENDFIDSLRHGDEEVWIGATDERTEGDFRWQDGTKLEWTNWNAGEPNNEDCAVMKSDKKWYSQSCHWRYKSKLVCAAPALGDETCYDNVDRGASYGGTVRVTDASQACVPWAAATKCPHNPFIKGDEQKNLVANLCRNPDNSPGPWCYVHADTCDKKYCSVCEHEHVTDYTKVRCPSPTPPQDGEIQIQSGATLKSQYKVGDTVDFTCKGKGKTIPITTTCLTSGFWSPVGLACTECPMGYDVYKDQCYGFVDKLLNFIDAQKYCNDSVGGGYIASPKNSAQNDFVHSLSQGRDVWVGANDIDSEGKWIWEDGSEMTWNNWESGEPNDWGIGEDAAVMKSNKKWNDISVSTKAWLVCSTRKEDMENLLCEDLLKGRCSQLLSLNPAMCRRDYKSFSSQFCAKTCGLCSTTPLVECDVPSSSDSSITVDTDKSTIQPGDFITFSCANLGFYPIKGSRERACLPSGRLSGMPLECKDVLDAPTVTIGPAQQLLSNGVKETPERAAFFGEGDQYSIEVKGQLVAWVFYSSSQMETGLQVWRSTSTHNVYRLVGQNTITTSPTSGQQRYDVPVGERISVEPGDFIGIVNAGKGGIRFTPCDKNANPELHGHFVWSGKVQSVQDFVVGNDKSFNSGDACVLFPLQAIVAVLD